MEHSYVRKLLYDLSIKLGRKPQEMERFIKALEDQWYDSKESLAKLQPADYARLQIPERLATMIAEAVGGSKHNQMSEKMDIESPVDNFLINLKKGLNKTDFGEVVSSLSRIFNNIRENLINEKYRMLKKSNAKIAALTSVRQVVSILKYGGFEDCKSAFVMSKVNIGQIDQCIESIEKFDESKNFDPYSEHISSIGKTTIDNYEGSSSIQYNKMLEDLEKERTKVMSQAIYDRKIKIFQIEPQNFKEFDRKFQEERQNEEETKFIQLQYMKELLKKQGEEPKFANRRMQEYNQLVKKPVYSQTLIRVKLPQNWVFECRFAPLQTLQSLVDVFHDCLQNKNLDYYLYMTPPVEKLKGVLLKKTFYELGCIPRAIFYMKTEQMIKGNLFRVKKSLF